MLEHRKPPAPPPMESMVNMTVRVTPGLRSEIEQAAAEAGEEPTRHARRMIRLGLQVSRMGLNIAESRTTARARISMAPAARRKA